MTNYNALAMFEYNNTQKFINTLFMEPGDFKFLCGQACAYKEKDWAKQKEMVLYQQEKKREVREGCK